MAIVLAAGALGAWLAWRAPHLGYHFDWRAAASFLVRSGEDGVAAGVLVQGLATTVRLSVWSIVLGLAFGGAAALARLGRLRFLRWLAAGYVIVMRNTPPLVLLFLFYFFISSQVLPLEGAARLVRAAPPWVQAAVCVCAAPPAGLENFLSAILALGAYEGAYIAEIVRAGLQAVPKAQLEAAAALGLAPWARLRHVVWPQALVVIIPPLAGQLVSAIKDSAIVSAISVRELTFQGQELMAASYRTLEVWLLVTLLYLALTLACSLIGRGLERWLTRHLSSRVRQGAFPQTPPRPARPPAR